MELPVRRRDLAGAAALALLVLAPVTGFASERVAFSLDPAGEDVGDERVREVLYQFGIDGGAVDVLSGVTPLLGEADVGVFGDVEVGECPELTLTVTEFGEQLAAAEEHISFAEYDSARPVLQSLRERLACLKGPVESTDLHRLHLLEGVVRWYGGDRHGAREAFVRAVHVEPDYRWRGEFGPGPQETHVEAERAVVNGDWGALVLAWDQPIEEVRIDGHPVELQGGRAAQQLSAGPHLLQVRAPEQPTRAWLLRMAGDTVVIDRAALEAGMQGLVRLERGDAVDPALRVLSIWLLERDIQEAWLVRTHGVSRETGDGGRRRGRMQFRLARLDPRQRQVRAPAALLERLGTYPWRGKLDLVGGMMLLEREDMVYHYGTVDLTIWLATLPATAVGLEVGLAAHADPASGDGFLVVPVRAHLRFSPDYGPVRPFGDVSVTAMWLGARPSGPEFAGGIEGEGGVAFRPFRERRIGFIVGAGGGYVGGPTFHVRGGTSFQW